MKVYLIKDETTIGPIFSTLEDAQLYLDEDFLGRINWIEAQEYYGYPQITEFEIDDSTYILDK